MQLQFQFYANPHTISCRTKPHPARSSASSLPGCLSTFNRLRMAAWRLKVHWKLQLQMIIVKLYLIRLVRNDNFVDLSVPEKLSFQTFVRWALYILFKFVKSLTRHLDLDIRDARCVRWFSWTLPPLNVSWLQISIHRQITTNYALVNQRYQTYAWELLIGVTKIYQCWIALYYHNYYQ